LLRCAFLRKLSGCVRNITAFCQHLLRPIPIYWPIYRLISSYQHQKCLSSEDYIMKIAILESFTQTTKNALICRVLAVTVCDLSTWFVVLWALTPWWPVYKYIVHGNQPKTSSFQLPYQCHSSSTDCTRELFKPSNDSASLLICTWKKFFVWGLCNFWEWCHKWSSFFARVTCARAQLLGQNISLKFSLETKLESESFKPLTF